MEEIGLERFLSQQKKEFDLALYEIKSGKKISCWMWYIFPQIRGLGQSAISNYYGIKDINEGILYLKNEKLKHNLMVISKALLDLGYVDISKVFGYTDALKLRSSMTLFDEIERISGIYCNNIFEKVLKQFFTQKDINTLKIIKKQQIKVDREKIDNLQKIRNEEKQKKEEMYKLYSENNGQINTDNGTIITYDSNKGNNGINTSINKTININNSINSTNIDSIINSNSTNNANIDSAINSNYNNFNINIPEIKKNNAYVVTTKNHNYIGVNPQNMIDANNDYKINKENNTDKIIMNDKDIYNIGTNTTNYSTYNSVPETYYNYDNSPNYINYSNNFYATPNIKANTTDVINSYNDAINNYDNINSTSNAKEITTNVNNSYNDAINNSYNINGAPNVKVRSSNFNNSYNDVIYNSNNSYNSSNYPYNYKKFNHHIIDKNINNINDENNHTNEDCLIL